MDESEIQQRIQIEAVKYKCQLLRNNSGALRDADGRFVRFGLGNISKNHSDNIKSSDLVGFKQVLITQDMVGKIVAVFTAVEVKKPDWRPSAKDPRERAQGAFIDWVKANGGLGGFCNSVESLRKIIGL